MRAKKIRNKKRLLKLFSFLASIFIWFYVLSSAKVEGRKEIKLTVNNLGVYSIKNLESQRLEINLKGPRILVEQYIENNNDLFFDMRKLIKDSQKKYELIITENMLQLPLGIDVVDFFPRKIKLEIDRTVTKAIPVNLDESKYEFYPKKVEVTGAKSNIRLIKKLAVDDLDSANLEMGKTYDVKVTNPLPYLKIKEPFVSVKLKGISSL